MAMRRQLAQRGLAVLFGLLVALLGLELLVRVAYDDTWTFPLPPELASVDAALGWRLSGGWEGWHETEYFRTYYETNERGCRDHDVPKTSPSEAFRVMLHGDSQVFGWGLERAERFSDLLETRVHGLELRNCAVPGYGLDQQVLAYRRDGSELEVDGVAFFLSDATLLRCQRRYLFGIHKPFIEQSASGQWYGFEPAPRKLWRRWLDRRPEGIRFLGFLEHRLSLLDAKIEQNSPSRTDPQARVDALLRLALGLAQERDHELVLLIERSPYVEELIPPWSDQAPLRRLSFEVPADEKFKIAAEDPHWNARGHRLVAEQLATQLAVPVEVEEQDGAE